MYTLCNMSEDFLNTPFVMFVLAGKPLSQTDGEAEVAAFKAEIAGAGGLFAALK